MNMHLEPLQPSEADDFISIFWQAFNPIEADMILPMIYPLGFQPDLKERLRTRILKGLNEDPSNLYFCAKDSSTGQIVGVSWWGLEENPPQTQEELDQDYQKAMEKRRAGVTVEGTNQELENAFFKAASYSEAEAMGSKPYMTLKVLAIPPDYARKGVGTLLLRQGLEKTDNLDLPSFIHGGVQAKPLYARHGFKVLREVPCKATDYGGRSPGLHWRMVRPSRSEILNEKND